MFEIEEQDDGKLLAIRLKGRLRGEDYQRLGPQLDAAIARHGKVRLICDATAWEGISPDAVWEDLKLGLRHFTGFDRVALIGERDWMAWATKLGDAIMPYKMRFFTADQADAAWHWIKG